MLTPQTEASQAKTSVKQIEVNETNLAFIEKGAGEPIVFIHCEMTDYRAWSEQFEFFSRNYRAISYSSRHHQPNTSANGSANYSRVSQTEDLIGFLKALDLEKAHLVGHSYGASIALLAALEKPELIGSLVLAEPTPFPNLLNESGMELLLLQRAGFNEAARLARNKNKEEAVRQFLHVVFGIDVFELLPEERRAVVLENAVALEPMIRSYYDLPHLSWKQLKNVHIPTLLLTGEISPKISRVNNEMINCCLPNSKIEILRGASHGLQMENPEGFNQLVFNFLRTNRI